jgi:predicted amidohydrolase
VTTKDIYKKESETHSIAEKVLLYQRDIFRQIPDKTEEIILKNLIKDHTTIIFPEYVSQPPELTKYSHKKILQHHQKVYDWFLQLSKDFRNQVFIAGSLLSKHNSQIFNTSFVFFQGNVLSQYQKRRLFGFEKGKLFEGKKKQQFIHPLTQKKWGLLICADVFIPTAFIEYQECDYIAIPTLSPYKKNDTVKDQVLRDKQIFQNGAIQSKAVIFKCCCNQQKENKPTLVQGRSLIADADHITNINQPFESYFLSYNSQNNEINFLGYDNSSI